MLVYPILVVVYLLHTKCIATPADNTWIDPSVWIDLGSGAFISDDLWTDPDLMDLKTCSKVLDEFEDDTEDDLPNMDVINMPNLEGHHSGVETHKSWPGGLIPTLIEPGMTIKEMKRLACAFTFFAEKTCIRFAKKQASHQNYLKITKWDKRLGCFSESLGMAGGEQIVNLDLSNYRCWRHGTIVHELMHVVGFFHEQARNDRDKYIELNWNDIPDGCHRQYETASELGISQQLVGTYDYSSVMHYSRYLSSSMRPTMTAKMHPIEENNEAMGNRRAPTEMDAEKINILYCNQSNAVSCDEGRQTLERTVTRMNNTDGKPCPPLESLLVCNTQPCPKTEDCEVSDWNATTPCSASCDQGLQTLERTVLMMNGSDGAPCPILEREVLCNIQPCPRHGDTKILIIGGSYHDLNARNSMELYHPFSPQLNRATNVAMIQGRYDHTSALMDDGAVITVGGWADGYLSSCERFNPSTSAVTLCPSLNKGRRYAASSVLDGALIVCGGWDGWSMDSCERLLSNVWQDSASMNNERSGFAIVSLNGYLYAIGGQDGYPPTILSSVERLSGTDGQWTYVQPMNSGRRGHSAAVMEGEIFVCGGNQGDNMLSSCEEYSPTNDQWLDIAQMQQKRTSFGLVSDGKNLFAMGQFNDQTAEVYHKSNNTWNMMQNKLILRRWSHSAVFLP